MGLSLEDGLNPGLTHLYHEMGSAAKNSKQTEVGICEQVKQVVRGEMRGFVR